MCIDEDGIITKPCKTYLKYSNIYDKLIGIIAVILIIPISMIVTILLFFGYKFDDYEALRHYE